MFYSLAITIPANTLAAKPLEQELRMGPGVIHRVSVGFPGGCVGLAHLQILQHDHQLWPTNPDASLASDDHQLEWDDYWELADVPYSLTLRAWNLDDTYDHTVTVRIGVLPVEAYWREGRSATMIEALAQAFNLIPGSSNPSPPVGEGQG